MKLKILPVLLAVLLLGNCASTNSMHDNSNDLTYKQISMNEAVELMESETN